VGSWTEGSGTFSIRTSPAPYMMVARMKRIPLVRREGRFE
jgi:hypothetical protein